MASKSSRYTGSKMALARLRRVRRLRPVIFELGERVVCSPSTITIAPPIIPSGRFHCCKW